MKKLLSILLSALMVLSLVPAGVFVFTAVAAEVGETDWSAVDAADVSGHMLYINSADDWSAFLGGAGTYDGATVYLCQSIDVSAVTGVGPIADFKGTFDGQGFTVTGLKTGLFTTLSGALNNVTLNLNYHGLKLNVINDMNGTMSNVTFTGTLHERNTDVETSHGNVLIYNVTGNITNLTIDNLRAYQGGGGHFIVYVKDGVVIDGLTLKGSNSMVNQAVADIAKTAVLNNVKIEDFARTVFGVIYGTINGLTIECPTAADIILRYPRENCKINDVEIRNNSAEGFQLFYFNETTASCVVNGLTYEGGAAKGDRKITATLQPGVTIKNLVVNNATRNLFDNVWGTIEGLTVNGANAPLITTVGKTGVVDGITAYNASGAALFRDVYGTVKNGEVFADSSFTHGTYAAYVINGANMQNLYSAATVSRTGSAANANAGTTAATDKYGIGGIAGAVRYTNAAGDGDKWSGKDAPVSFTNCWFDGTVSGSGVRGVAGILGSNFFEASYSYYNVIFTDCLNTGRISGGLWVGGIMGYSCGDADDASDSTDYSNPESTYVDCVNLGTLSSTESSAYLKGCNPMLGLAGAWSDSGNDADATFTNCYGLVGVSLFNNYTKNVGTTITGTVAELNGSNASYTTAATSLGWQTWTNDNGVTFLYPSASFEDIVKDSRADVDVNEFDNTNIKNFEINNVEDWKDFLSSTNSFEGATVKLMGNIDVSSVAGVGPIANFKGTFDGQNFAVNNIKTGVFATVSGTVQNVTFDVKYANEQTLQGYLGINADLIDTLAAGGNLVNLTFTGILSANLRDPNPIADSGNVFINTVNGTINGLTINAYGFTGGGGNLIKDIAATGVVNNLIFADGSSNPSQMYISKLYGKIYNLQVINKTGIVIGYMYKGALIDGGFNDSPTTQNNRSGDNFIRNIEGGAIKNFTFKNLTKTGEYAVFNTKTTTDEFLMENITVDTIAAPLFNRALANLQYVTIKNLVVKNCNVPVFNMDIQSIKTLNIDGITLVNTTVNPIQGTNVAVNGKLFAGYMDAQGNVIEDITTYEGDATVKFVDPAMVAVVAQGKKQNDGKYTLRFLTTVDRLDGYKNVKISITRDGKEGAYGKEMTTVYSSVLADGVSIDAATVTGVSDSKYIATYEIRNIPAEAANVMFSATATVTMADGSTITSTTGGACNCTVAGTVPGYTA